MPGQSSWREVPQVLFLSWSAARQYAYCAARDEDSATHSDNPDLVTLYRERAAIYRELAARS